MNYLLLPCYAVNEAPDPESLMEKMVRAALASYRKNLAGPWKEHIARGSFVTPTSEAQMTMVGMAAFFLAFTLWNGNNNVLMVDADTICRKPTEIFGKYHEMFMPYFTCGPDWSRQKFPKGYMNGGVVYFPSSMERSVWHIGFEKMTQLDYNYCSWDTTQAILNEMFWAQTKQPDPDPKLNYSARVETPISYEDAQIVHFHASRGPAAALQQMQAAL